jgi:hypothetical protein
MVFNLYNKIVDYEPNNNSEEMYNANNEFNTELYKTNFPVRKPL